MTPWLKQVWVLLTSTSLKLLWLNKLIPQSRQACVQITMLIRFIIIILLPRTVLHWRPGESQGSQQTCKGSNSFEGEFNGWVALFYVPFTNICFTEICVQTALYSGLRKMEWLLISCHNYWTVCLLVRDDNHWSLFELCLVPFYPMSKMSLSGVARTVQIWNLIL